MAQRPTVLLIESNRTEREQMASWINAGGMDVLECPGPSGPDYSCLGGRGKPCPLAMPADVVVLDMYLESDAVLRGTPAWELLLYYLHLGKRVVALAGESDPLEPLPDDEIEIVRRPAQREPLLRAIHQILIHAEAGVG